ncbi:hypothetical protein CLU79DRAFT_701221, partial [Phycomyces nitens]
WPINIHHSTRNIRFRFLHDKLSSSQRLNQILPVVFPSPLCRVCQLSTDTDVHFLYLCLQKYFFFGNEPHPADVERALHTFSFPRIVLTSSLCPEQVMSGILLAIWRSYWQRKVDEVPFSAMSTISGAIKLILVFVSERTN